MAKIKKRRLRWDPSTSSHILGYKLYWAEGGGVNYDSDCALVGNVTHLILPDDVPLFPIVKGSLELGLTAVDETGNESDMTKFYVPFQFSIPDPPMNPVLETMQDYHIYHGANDNPGASKTGHDSGRSEIRE